MKQGLKFFLRFQTTTGNFNQVLLVLLLMMFSVIIPVKGQQEADSLEKLLPAVTIDSSRINLLNDLSQLVVDTDPLKAIRYADEALKISEAAGIQKSVAASLHNLGNAHYNQAEYKLALYYYIKSLHIQEAIGNKRGILSASGSIGNVFLDTHQPDQALIYFQQSLAIAKELNSKRGIASSLIAMGTVYSDKLNYKASLDYCFKALAIFQEIDFKDAVATCYNNIADSYHKMNDNTKAMFYVNKAYDVYKEVGSTYGMALALNNIGDFYQSIHHPDKALEYFGRGLEQAVKINAGDRIIASYKGMTAAYREMGRYKEALEVTEKFQKMNDSVYNTENSKQIAEMQARFETDKKAKEIDLLTKDKKIKEDELIRQRFISWAMAIGGILVLMLALLAIRANLQKRKANRELEEKNQKIETAYSIIEDQHKDIKDSIRYAERLQNAILPTAGFNRIFGDNAFVLYKPKDIVSGDFYWVESIEKEGQEQRMFAAVDCTGHGVPGAFMSIVGHNLLKQAVKEHHRTKPSEILNELNSGLSETLRQKEEDSVVKDGMDMALCSLRKIGPGKSILQFAGANNPLWVVRKDVKNIEEIKGDKFPIGIFLGQKLHQFNNHEIELNSGDTVYIFTDGYADQFGGEKGKKFKYKALQELILSVQDKSMAQQQQALEKVLINWKGTLEQVDDILVIGVKV